MRLYDHYGREIVEGAKVVYNYCGYPRFGTVKEVKDSNRKYGKPYTIFVDNLELLELSKVTDASNLVVL